MRTVKCWSGQQVNVDLVRHCAGRYDTTLSATALQLTRFIERPVVLIVSKGGKVEWSRSSAMALKMGIYFKKGLALPSDSLSMKCVNAGSAHNNTCGMVADAAIWSKKGWVRESTLVQTYYGTVLTLLEFESLPQTLLDDEEVDESSDIFEYLKQL